MATHILSVERFFHARHTPLSPKPIAQTYTIGPLQKTPSDLNGLADGKQNTPSVAVTPSIGASKNPLADLMCYTDEAHRNPLSARPIPSANLELL